MKITRYCAAGLGFILMLFIIEAALQLRYAPIRRKAVSEFRDIHGYKPEKRIRNSLKSITKYDKNSVPVRLPESYTALKKYGKGQ